MLPECCKQHFDWNQFSLGMALRSRRNFFGFLFLDCLDPSLNTEAVDVSREQMVSLFLMKGKSLSNRLVNRRQWTKPITTKFPGLLFLQNHISAKLIWNLNLSWTTNSKPLPCFASHEHVTVQSFIHREFRMSFNLVSQLQSNTRRLVHCSFWGNCGIASAVNQLA